MTEISVGYDHSPLNGPEYHHTGIPAPGKRLAPTAGHNPVGSGDEPRFALFAADGDAKTLVRKFPNLLEATPRPPLDPNTVALIRPDGYVACVAKAGHVDAVEGYLERISIAACVDA